MKQEIFKLIFEHDLRLEQLSGNYDPRQERKKPASIEDFMKPVPTYSRFYFSGTRLAEQHFGLTALSEFETIRTAFFEALKNPALSGKDGTTVVFDSELLTEPDHTFLVQSAGTKAEFNPDARLFDPTLSLREKIEWLRPALDAGFLVLFTEKAHNGTDWHLFSKKNIYESFFHVYQPMISDDFRFFSINGKRMGSERLFYFETWTLDRPPHGFEEVFAETRLR